MDRLPSNLDLDNPEFQQAYRLLNQTNVNVFLTGRAGTGKSTFLRYICNKIQKKFVVLAPTGVAAVNAGGVTIHSFFQMPLRPVPPDDPDYSVKSFIKSHKLSRQKQKLIRELDLIIIDEVSMVRADMIDFIDRVLRGVRRKRGVPFGGVQLLLVGDIFQLEPVVTPDTRSILSRYYHDFFFFSALAYKQVQLVAVELKKMYRQSDQEFISLLDRIRVNKVTEDDLILLNSKKKVADNTKEETEDKFSIVLTSRRDTASLINNDKMARLPGEETIYEGEIEDDFPEKILPTDMHLSLKIGAQVMLIRNDRERRWVNGTLAKVTGLDKDFITVELEEGREVRVEREIWENITYSFDEKEKKVVENVIGRFSQFPLRAAWALTIHKSQGLTFTNVDIDMAGGAFSAGQTYVALSRCRSLEGLKFINPIRRYDVIVSYGAREFSKSFNDLQAAENALREAEERKLSLSAKRAFNDGDMRGATELMWQLNNLSGLLAKKAVRRLIAFFLSRYNKLKSANDRSSTKLKKASKELCRMGDFFLKDLKELEKARKAYEASLEADETNTYAMLGLAQIMIETDKDKEAQKILKAILEFKDRNYLQASLIRGDLLAKEGNVDAAASSYLAASKRFKKDKSPIERLIRLYDKAGNEEMASRWEEYLLENYNAN